MTFLIGWILVSVGVFIGYILHGVFLINSQDDDMRIFEDRKKYEDWKG
jgi:hypothetical protein